MLPRSYRFKRFMIPCSAILTGAVSGTCELGLPSQSYSYTVSSCGSTLCLERTFGSEKAELTLDPQTLETELVCGEKKLLFRR